MTMQFNGMYSSYNYTSFNEKKYDPFFMNSYIIDEALLLTEFYGVHQCVT